MKALNEFETLAEAQAYSYTDERMVSPDMVISLLTQFDCTLSLDSASYTDNKAKGFTMALSGSVTEFNVMNSHPVGQAQQAVLTHLVSINAVTQDFADYLIGYANQVKQPYTAVTQEELDWEVRKLQPTIKTIPFQSGNPTFTLNQSIPQVTSVTFWGVKEGYKTENLGRAIHVDEALNYTVDLSGKHGYDNLEIRVNASGVNFDVSY